MSGNKYNKKNDNLCTQIRNHRKEEGWSYERLDAEYTSQNLQDILSCVVGTCKCENDDVEYIDAREDEPWKEKYVVETLYIEEELRFTEMSNVMDCHSETAKKYVDIFNVSPVDSSKRTSSPRVNNLLRLGAETNGDIDIK